MRLDGKAAFVTGGSSGIGLATAKLFVREGARVTITGRDRAKLDVALAALGPDALAFAADVEDDAAMAEALAATVARFGRLDVVVANVARYIDATLGDTPRSRFAAALEIGVTSVFMTVQSALPHLKRGASVVITGSVYATMGPPGGASYAASKGAVGAMARVMASELAPRGIRVNVVVPGAVDTPSWGFSRLDPAVQETHIRKLGDRALIDRMITAEEVAAAILFLASDEASGITASEVTIDGGATGAVAGSPRFRRAEPE